MFKSLIPSADDEMMRAMVYEGVSGVSDKRGDYQCTGGFSDVI